VSAATPLVRMFAGPNGWGKSVLKSYLPADWCGQLLSSVAALPRWVILISYLFYTDLVLLIARDNNPRMPDGNLPGKTYSTGRVAFGEQGGSEQGGR